MKRTISNILFYVTIGFGCTMFSILIGNAIDKIDKNISTSTNPNCTYTIVIDAGHGGEDSGAVGINGIMEKDINLEISKKLKDLFEVSGFKVEMIRDSDVSIYEDDANTTRKQKVSDLRNRLNIINSNPDNILISIHQNKFTDSKYYGAQMFYSSNNQESKEIATHIKKAFVNLIQPENTREIKPAGKNIYLLSNATVPAVIVECGFLSNPEEAQKLNSDEYQSKVAFAVFCGFLEWTNNKAG